MRQLLHNPLQPDTALISSNPALPVPAHG